MGKFLLGFVAGAVFSVYMNHQTPTRSQVLEHFHPRVGMAPAMKVRVAVKEPTLEQLEDLGFAVKRSEYADKE